VVLDYLIISNLIYLFFNFINWHLLFYVFLLNLICTLLIIVYFTFNIFYWILFFDLTPNHLILIFLLNLILIPLIAIPFILSYLLDYLFCFCNFIPYCLISLNFHIIFGAYFFYHTFKTQSVSQPQLCSRSRSGSNNRGYQGQLDFLSYNE